STGWSIIDGHVGGLTTGGIFKNLANIKQGDEYEVETGDGSVKRYRVLESLSSSEEKAPSILFSQDPSVASQLNLITCSGTFNTQSRRYSDRVIVTSQLM